MEKIYNAFFHEAVRDFLSELSRKDHSRIWGIVETMEAGDLHSPRTKTLRGPIKELIVKEYRILFFIHEHTIHFVRVFRKKSVKTPQKEIEYVERIYKMLLN